MTEFSFPWGCDPTGDGGTGSFTVDVVQKMNMYLANPNRNLWGVIYYINAPYTGLLAATNPGGNIVRIASGLGLVEGWLYENDSTVDFDVTGGAANATDLIVLRRSNPGAAPQTVRLELVRGPAGGTAVVTQNASVWEIALWQVQLTAAGNFSALVDVRQYIGARWVHYTIQATTGYAFAGSGNTQIRFDATGVLMSSTDDTLISIGWRVPEEYLSGLTITSVVLADAGAGGNMRSRTQIWHAKCGETINPAAPDVDSGVQTIAVSALQVGCVQTVSLPAAAVDDQIFFKFERYGNSDVLDTAGNMVHHGIEVYYLERTMDNI